MRIAKLVKWLAIAWAVFCVGLLVLVVVVAGGIQTHHHTEWAIVIVVPTVGGLVLAYILEGFAKRED